MTTSALVPRLLSLWTDPLSARVDPVADFAEVYADPTIINGSPVSVGDLVARAAALQEALPNRTTELLDVVETPGKVAVAFVVRARHDGTLASPLGPVAATGREIEARAIDVLTITDDRVSQIWVVADDLGMLRQLDAVRLT